MSEKNLQEMSFEEAIKELEGTIHILENSSSANLDDSIKYYERANEIRSYCEKKLKEAKIRIDEITQSKSKQE